MQLSIDNLTKPSEKKWKRLADWLLFTVLPSLNVMFLYIESKDVVSPEFAMWGVAITSFLIPCFKGLTKFTAEPQI